MDRDHSRKKLFLQTAGISLVLAVAASLIYGISRMQDTPSSELEPGASEGAPIEIGMGSVLPNLGFQDLSGKKLTLSSVKSKVTLINFWATWCESCLVEMPSIQKLYDKYKANGLEVVAISLDEPSTLEDIAPLVKKLNLSFGIYTDPEQRLADLLSLSAIPVTIVVDAERRILMVENGEKEWFDDETQAAFQKWLSQSAQSNADGG